MAVSISSIRIIFIKLYKSTSLWILVLMLLPILLLVFSELANFSSFPKFCQVRMGTLKVNFLKLLEDFLQTWYCARVGHPINCNKLVKRNSRSWKETNIKHRRYMTGNEWNNTIIDAVHICSSEKSTVVKAKQRAAMLPSMLQKLDGHRSSDAGQYTRRVDPSHDYQKHDLTATNTNNITKFHDYC